ncbi:MAG TPA: FAD-binding protein [Ramlibacter sp.]|nr:FAD-binding protein [Ramlibacter sp.]
MGLFKRNSNVIDLLVAGSGSGALTAAIAAHDAGLRVAIYEKASVVGGGTAYSGGVVWAPCNHMMRAKGIQDSVDDALLYLRQASGDRGDETLQRTYVENVGQVIEQVQSWTGIKWIIWPGQPDYYSDLPGACPNGRAILQHPNSAHQVLAPAEEAMPDMKLVRLTPHMDFVPGFQNAERPARESWLAGRAVIGGLWKAVLERRIPFRVSARVSALRTEKSQVVGAEIEHADGSREEVVTRIGVLLNTGGYDWNDELARRHLPGPHLVPQTPPSNTGDGHLMAMQLGAATALMDKAVFHPAIHIPGELQDGRPLYRMFNAELSKPHSILVNRTGRRFTSEAAYFAVCEAWNAIDHRLRSWRNLPCYLVMDARYRAKYGLPGVGAEDPIPDWIHQAATLESLAARLGVDAAGLAAEVATYNGDCEQGVDTRFGRGQSLYESYWGDPNQQPNPTMGPLSQAPYYAFEVYASHAGARGGVLTTPSAEVLRADGSIIPGLYACGNTAANLLFGAGYGSGSAVGSSMVFGYLAAMKMARARTS